MIFVSPFYDSELCERRNPTMQSLQIKAILTVLKNGIDYSDINDGVAKSLGLLPYNDLVSSLKHTSCKTLTYPNEGLLLSAGLGFMDGVMFFINCDANDFNSAMTKAASRGHIDIVELMINNGANAFDKTLTCAAYGGYIDIVELMIKYGANDFDEAMADTTFNGHIDIHKLLLKHGAENFWY